MQQLPNRPQSVIMIRGSQNGNMPSHSGCGCAFPLFSLSWALSHFSVIAPMSIQTTGSTVGAQNSLPLSLAWHTSSAHAFMACSDLAQPHLKHCQHKNVRHFLPLQYIFSVSKDAFYIPLSPSPFPYGY
jgi:hypothetical protein